MFSVDNNAAKNFKFLAISLNHPTKIFWWSKQNYFQI